jgi:hypothetical protein
VADALSETRLASTSPPPSRFAPNCCAVVADSDHEVCGLSAACGASAGAPAKSAGTETAMIVCLAGAVDFFCMVFSVKNRPAPAPRNGPASLVVRMRRHNGDPVLRSL